MPEISNQPEENGISQGKKSKCIDLSYLNLRTKSNPKLMMEMITVYLEQTRSLISVMKQSLHDENWAVLNATAHKMVPSFSIMGIDIHFEDVAKKIQDYENTADKDKINDLVLQLENICTQSCEELEEELTIIKNSNS